MGVLPDRGTCEHCGGSACHYSACPLDDGNAAARYRAALRAIASPSGKTIAQAESIARNALAFDEEDADDV